MFHGIGWISRRATNKDVSVEPDIDGRFSPVDRVSPVDPVAPVNRISRVDRAN